ncbi:hypothetical protein LCGC14_0622650 [marine sediment metagenome]|uniref:Uncharacterized protein n=1 Tax=marine sediment metagenome TaxID=412755 RepID=A0A0F9R9D7_9ZZZZ
MINDTMTCWICKKKMGKSGSEHHLFNFYDFKIKMLQTFPNITKNKIRLAWLKTKDKIPSYKVHYKCHCELEKKLRNEYNCYLKGTWEAKDDTQT